MKYRYRFPLELEFEPIQLCNAKCFTCPYTELSKDLSYINQSMERNQIEKLLIDFFENNLKYNPHERAIVMPFRYSDPLLCKHLDFIFEITSRYNGLVFLTTNAKGFNKQNIETLNKFSKFIAVISVSIIGDSEQNVTKYMGPVSLHKTINILDTLKNSLFANKIKISLRNVDCTDIEQKNLINLQNIFKQMNYDCQIKSNWISNRNEQNLTKFHPTVKSKENFIVGCRLNDDRILKRLEVMVNGDVVLCCDDAVGQVVFGNVFNESIKTIWDGQLFDYTKLIYQTHYSQNKDNLICAKCSRGIFNTDPRTPLRLKKRLKNLKKKFSFNFISI